MAKIEVKNKGTILKVDCPKCKENSEYQLIEEIDYAPAIYKLLFVKDEHRWRIECKNCQHFVKVPPLEADKLHIIDEMGAKMQSGEIPPDEFYAVFSQFSFVVELLNQSHAWDCPTCNENVSWNYQVCWSCDTPNPDFDGMENQRKPPQFIPPSCGFNVISQ